MYQRLNYISTKERVGQDMVCSQSSVRTFDNIAWQQMCKDLEPAAGEIFLPNKYNIRWIKATADAKKLINQKAPFLAAMIQNIDVVSGKISIANVTLKDSTGEIQGTINHDLYKQYSSDFTLNSVVVLKQIGVLTTQGPKHYLNITANNLVKIYSLCQPEMPYHAEKVNPKETAVQNTCSETSQQNLQDLGDSELNTIVIQNFNTDDFLKSLENVKDQDKCRRDNKNPSWKGTTNLSKGTINLSKGTTNVSFQKVNFGNINAYGNINANDYGSIQGKDFGVNNCNKNPVGSGSKPNETNGTLKQKVQFQEHCPQ